MSGKNRAPLWSPRGGSFTDVDPNSLGVPTDGVALFDGIIAGRDIQLRPGGMLSTLGALLKIQYADSGAVDLATDGAATTLTLDVPSGAQLIGVAFAITTDVEGVDSTTGTLALSGGSSVTVGTVSAFTDSERITKLLMADANALTTDTTNIAFTLSGGSDNTPSAGAARAVAVYATLSGLT